MPLTLLPLPRTGMTHGLGLLLHLLHICDHPGRPRLQKGPEPLAQVSHPVGGPRSLSPHMFKGQLLTSLLICPGYPRTLQLQSISRLSSPTWLSIDNGPTPCLMRWFAYYPGIRQQVPSYSEDSFLQVCSSSTTYYSPTYFRFSIYCRGDEPFWRLFIASSRAFGLA